MSSCPPRAPPAPPLEFSRVFHALDTLRAHIESLQHCLELAVQQQWQRYQAQCCLIPGQPPQKGPLPSTSPSPSILSSPTISDTLAPSSAEQDSETRAHLMMIRRVYKPLPHHGATQSPAVSLLRSQPHPHVYGHGYIQAHSYPSSQAQQQILPQINAAREAIGAANQELNHVIEEAVGRGADGVLNGMFDLEVGSGWGFSLGDGSNEQGDLESCACAQGAMCG